MQMKKFINDPDNLTAELLEGLAMANPDILELGEDDMVINKKLAEADRVTIVTQGGSGHEPAISGFVGEGMVDISRGGRRVRGSRAAGLRRRHQDGRQGQGRALHRAEPRGRHADRQHDHEKMRERGPERGQGGDPGGHRQRAPRATPTTAADWWAAFPPTRSPAQRRAEGKSLEEVAAVAQRFADNMATLAVAVRGATHPATGSLLAELGDDEMEIGMGQHGEERRRTPAHEIRGRDG